ncbi:MAG: hypothetical protein JSR72_06200 [Proteobacteria bacterium]|nr:hypothetical protein [Pseudomonadota bacterium]
MKYSRIAERLLVHARLCRELASATTDPAMARKLLELAEDCLRGVHEERRSAAAN